MTSAKTKGSTCCIMVNRYINIWELFFPSHFGSEFKTFQLKLFNLATSYNRTIPRSASENTASRFFFYNSLQV